MRSALFRAGYLVSIFGGATFLSGAVSVERSVGSANIVQIASSPVADLVLIDAGHAAGLRQGMVCIASRDGRKIGELLLVDLRQNAASALILDLASGASLKSGDLVTVKTVSAKK